MPSVVSLGLTDVLPQSYRDYPDVLSLGNVQGTSLTLLASDLAATHHKLIVILPNPGAALLVYDYLKVRYPECLLLPDVELMPYDIFHVSAEIAAQRNATLQKILTSPKYLVVTSLPALTYQTPPADFYLNNNFSYEVGQTLDRTNLVEQLSQLGYQSVMEVRSPGEYALRGAILDFYPPALAYPVRVELLGDEISTLRSFDPVSQRTIEKINKLEYHPATEYPVDKPSIKNYLKSFKQTFEHARGAFYEQLVRGVIPAGFQFFLPLVYGKLSNVFEFIQKDTLILLPEESHASMITFEGKVKDRFEMAKLSLGFTPYQPSSLLISPKYFDKHPLASIKKIFYTKESRKISLAIENIEAFGKNPWQHLTGFVQKYPYRFLFSFESLARAQLLVQKVQQLFEYCQQFDSIETFINSEAKIGWTLASVEHGLVLKKQGVVLLPEAHLYSQKVVVRSDGRSLTRIPSAFAHVSELAEGSLVVHQDHGVGRYHGLKTLSINQTEKELLEIEYLDADRLYVPIHELKLLTPYQCLQPELVVLHKLGQSKWNKQKEKAYQYAFDQACELLKLYASRDAREGFSFEVPPAYIDFSEEFPFEETLDQKRAIEDVLADMTSKEPMDRLICGDVGFGKTEVAMRAAFVAVMNHKQVVILAPTTLLTQQHYETFLERFKAWPLRIACLTRFEKKQDALLKDLEAGRVDIVIGTHKLLQEDVLYKDLGLMIIDEEHRFGVAQKEAIKKIRSQIDILSMTATPIPRTLSMAFQGLRDLSIIATPPARRLSIQTFLHTYHLDLVRTAVERELYRGGQIYYVFNDIALIYKKEIQLKNLIPQLRVGVVHGKMTESAMEHVMAQFYHQRLDLLLCTSIVETGIDVPQANTMIVEDAHLFGLSQLHQLRGRVGRSYHQAYAYLMVPYELNEIPPEAQSRLEALTRYQDLGSGFHLATHDLEMRGAGDLLGASQSGHTQEIGLELYKQFLEQAKRALVNPQDEGPVKVEVELFVSALISKSLVPEPPLRLKLYQQWDKASSLSELQALKIEFEERFGLMDETTFQWHRMSLLRWHARVLLISNLTCTPKVLSVEFSSKDMGQFTSRWIGWAQKMGTRLKFHSPTKFELKINCYLPQERLNFVENLFAYVRSETNEISFAGLS